MTAERLLRLFDRVADAKDATNRGLVSSFLSSQFAGS